MAGPVKFTRASDGTSLAYATTGSGPVVVHVRAWITHLELMWAEPSFRRFIDGLTDLCTVVRYDGRGNGLSERRVTPPTFDDLVEDLTAIVDAVATGPVTLWGSSFGGPVAIAYACRRPGRVERLILEGTFASLHDRLSADDRVTMAEVGRLLRTSPEVAATAISFLTDPAPSSRHERRAARLVASVEPALLRHLYGLAGRIDVRPLLADVRAPTLVMHRRDSRVFPVECARVLAAGIDGASLVELEGTEHNPWEGDTAPAHAAMRTFLGGSSMPSPRTMTLLFSDIVSSTELLQQLGDAVATAMFQEHAAMVERAVVTHGGTAVKRLGDGVLASFASAASAVRCAVVVRDEISARNRSANTPVAIRIGLAAGEPIADGDDLLGRVVHLAARVCSAARPSEVLVTDVVRRLAEADQADEHDSASVDRVTDRIAFGEPRAVMLKGFADPVMVAPA